MTPNEKIRQLASTIEKLNNDIVEGVEKHSIEKLPVWKMAMVSRLLGLQRFNQ